MGNEAAPAVTQTGLVVKDTGKGPVACATIISLSFCLMIS